MPLRPDTVIENATVITGDPDRPYASRVGLWNGAILGVDDDLDRFTWKDREMRMVLEKAGGSLVRIRFDDDVASEAISSSLEA